MLRPHSGAAIPPSTITTATTTRLRFIIAVHAVGADVRACATVPSRRLRTHARNFVGRCLINIMKSV